MSIFQLFFVLSLAPAGYERENVEILAGADSRVIAALTVFMRLFQRRCASSPAAHHDLRSRRNHRSGSRRLFPHGTVSGHLHLQARGGSQLDDLAHRQADQRRNQQAPGFVDRNRGVAGCWFVIASGGAACCAVTAIPGAPSGLAFASRLGALPAGGVAA